MSHTIFNSFPIVQELNQARLDFYDQRWSQGSSFFEKAKAWLGHKAITVVSLPANIVACNLALVGMTASCAVAAVKVAIFAVSLGNFQADWPTGFLYFGEAFISSGSEACRNAIELLCDAADIFYQTYRGIKHVTEYLSLDRLIEKITEVVGEILSFASDRLTLGFESASRDECDISTYKTPLEEATASYRIKSTNRSSKEILSHTIYSVLNIFANTVIAAVSAVACVVFSAIFVAKAIVCASTGINIPIPTAVGMTGACALSATGHVILDVANDIADGFISIYKISKATGLVKVVSSIAELLMYIPKALLD